MAALHSALLWSLAAQCQQLQLHWSVCSTGNIWMDCVKWQSLKQHFTVSLVWESLTQEVTHFPAVGAKDKKIFNQSW